MTSKLTLIFIFAVAFEARNFFAPRSAPYNLLDAAEARTDNHRAYVDAIRQINAAKIRISQELDGINARIIRLQTLHDVIRTAPVPSERQQRDVEAGTEQREPLRCLGIDDDCCTEEMPCGEGDGDCDSDAECEGDLICGDNNCPAGNDQIDSALLWNAGDDCCMRQA